MNIKSTLCIAIAGLMFSAPLSAQTAQKVENLLNERAVTWGSAAAFFMRLPKTIITRTGCWCIKILSWEGQTRK